MFMEGGNPLRTAIAGILTMRDMLGGMRRNCALRQSTICCVGVSPRIACGIQNLRSGLITLLCGHFVRPTNSLTKKKRVFQTRPYDFGCRSAKAMIVVQEKFAGFKCGTRHTKNLMKTALI